MYIGRHLGGFGAWEVQNGQPVIVPPGTPGAFPTREDAVASLKARTADPVATMLKAKGGSGAAPPSPALRLQNALKALGKAVGDPKLSKIDLDGVVGKQTVGAVNRAIEQKYIVTPYFPRPELTATHVKQSAVNLAPLVEAAVAAHGGTLPAPVVAAKKRAVAPASFSPTAVAVIPEPAPSSILSGNTVWYVVGGFGVLLALAVISKAVRGGSKRRVEAEA